MYSGLGFTLVSSVGMLVFYTPDYYLEMIMYGFWLLEIMKKVELGTCILHVISEATLEAL